jgi:hypothetical protein
VAAVSRWEDKGVSCSADAVGCMRVRVCDTVLRPHEHVTG